MTNHRQKYSQVWTALLGDFHWCNNGIDSNLRPNGQSNPWAKQFFQDMKDVAKANENETFFNLILQKGSGALLSNDFSTMDLKRVLKYTWIYEKKSY